MSNKKRIHSSERLLNSAMKLFVKKGYKGSSVAEITKDAGLTRGALYCHFETKEHLAREIIKLFEEKYLDKMIAYVEKEGGSPSQKFEKMMRFNVWFAGEHPDLCLFMTVISAEMCGSRNRLEPYLKSVYRKWNEFITGILKDGKRTGAFKKEIDPQMMAWVIIGVHDGVLLQKEMNRETIDLQTYTKQFRNLIISGVRSD
ncbi:MAG: TetR/AcrR family transcriptional regulator [Syntrophaceae bacterium]|nr:TetR/AcrR family transcriptional regulator [Syntrophaceae bacterium]